MSSLFSRMRDGRQRGGIAVDLAWPEVRELRDAKLVLSCLGQCLVLRSAGTVSGCQRRR